MWLRCLLSLLAILAALPAVAQDGRGCGRFHKVEAGETLRSITVRNFPHDRYRVIYDANRDILSDPARIEIGQLLYLPCPAEGPRDRRSALDAAKITPSLEDDVGVRLAKNQRRSLTATAPLIAAPQPDKTTPDAPVPSAEPPAVVQPRRAVVPPRLLALPGLAPLAGRDLPQRGMLADLLAEALGGGPGRPEVVFVDDAPAHLDALLPTGAFAVSFPWVQPACSAPGDDEARRLCTSFRFSHPLYEAELALYAGTEAAPGGSACLPRAIAPYDAAALELDGIEIVPGLDTADCFARLTAGTVDMAIADTLAAAPLHDGNPLRSVRRTLHAVAWAENPEGLATLARIDEGIARLQTSGRWFEIVSRHLSAYGERVAVTQ